MELAKAKPKEHITTKLLVLSDKPHWQIKDFDLLMALHYKLSHRQA